MVRMTMCLSLVRLCVEALVGEEDGDFCIKLEDQLIVTEDGFENITTTP